MLIMKTHTKVKEMKIKGIMAKEHYYTQMEASTLDISTTVKSMEMEYLPKAVEMSIMENGRII